MNPTNLMLAAAAGAGLAEPGLSSGDAVGSLIVSVVIAGLRSPTPSGTESPATRQHPAGQIKDWLAARNNAS